MAAYRAGDSSAFKELYDRYASVLYRTMLRDLRRPEEARDLVQQTFLQLHRARHDFDPSQRLRPWIFTIAMNLKREHFRRVKRRPESPLEGEAIEEVAEPVAGDERVAATRALRQGLSELPPDQREVIELHWFDGLSFSEVAQVVGASLSAVKVRAHRGYTRLRRLLEPKAPDSAPGGEKK
jgi:RNA polymerase sigma factor (sigma-70 family)